MSGRGGSLSEGFCAQRQWNASSAVFQGRLWHSAHRQCLAFPMPEMAFSSGWPSVPVTTAAGPEVKLELKSYLYEDGFVAWSLNEIFEHSFEGVQDFRLHKALIREAKHREAFCAQLGLSTDDMVIASQRQMEAAGAQCGAHNRQLITASTMGILIQMLLWVTRCKPTSDRRQGATFLLRGFLRSAIGDAPGNWQVAERGLKQQID